MNLTRFIKALQKIEAADPGNGELPVCLADWQEAMQRPTEAVAEKIAVVTGEYLANDTYRCTDDKFVIIGDDDYGND